MTNVLKLDKQKPGQSNLIDVLRKLMQNTNTNANQLSKNTGLAHTTVKRICSDPESNPTLDSIRKIADFFGVSANQLIGDEPLTCDQNSYRPDIDQWSKVPILTIQESISWPKNIEEIKQNENTKFVMTDINIAEETFAVITTDDTLEPKFSPGTILIFSPSKPVKNKDYVMVLLDGKELPQFRQILVDGPDKYAKTVNPNFPENALLKLEKDKYRIFGVLIQAKSNYI